MKKALTGEIKNKLKYILYLDQTGGSGFTGPFHYSVKIRFQNNKA